MSYDKKGYYAYQYKMFCNEEKGQFSSSTQILGSIYVLGHNMYLSYGEGKHEGYQKAFPEF